MAMILLAVKFLIRTELECKIEVVDYHLMIVLQQELG